EIALLAAHLMWDLGWFELVKDEGDAAEACYSARAIAAARQHFLESVILLELAADLSYYNAQLRFSLLRVYAWLGANASIIGHTSHPLLRLKYIQRDTLSFAFVPHYVRMTWVEALKSSIDETFSLQKGADRELYQAVQAAIQEGNHSQALDALRL